MLWIAILAQISAPQPKTIWFSTDDTPVGELPSDGEATVAMRIEVDLEGKIRSCAIEQSSGNPKIDNYSCALTLKRARFRAARWLDGTSSFGVYRTKVRWLAPGVPMSGFKPAGDLILNAKNLPKGVRSPAAMIVALAVDEQGEVRACAAENKKENQKLVIVACEHLTTAFNPVPPQDGGKPVRSVQRAVVVFEK